MAEAGAPEAERRMRSPEAARALPDLVAAGVLSAAQAAPLAAAARGDVVSVRSELRWLLGLGVSTLTGAVGLFLKEHHEAIGPTAIAGVLTLAALSLFWAVGRRAPAFTWGRADAPDWILDGLLLLALGIVGADLAWIEVHFTPLGAAWPWHLFTMSLLTGALAVRFDSRVAWSLALSTFAAWRGVAVTPSERALDQLFSRGAGELRWNLWICAFVFWLLGRLAVRFGRKPHFEPAATFLAALALGAGLALGLGAAGVWALWAVALAGAGTGIASWAFARRRLALFALGVIAAYVGVTRALLELVGGFGLGCFWFAASAVGAIVLLVVVHRRFQAAETP
jgi:hypothetical protein